MILLFVNLVIVVFLLLTLLLGNNRETTRTGRRADSNTSDTELTRTTLQCHILLFSSHIVLSLESGAHSLSEKHFLSEIHFLSETHFLTACLRPTSCLRDTSCLRHFSCLERPSLSENPFLLRPTSCLRHLPLCLWLLIFNQDATSHNNLSSCRESQLISASQSIKCSTNIPSVLCILF